MKKHIKLLSKIYSLYFFFLYRMRLSGIVYDSHIIGARLNRIEKMDYFVKSRIQFEGVNNQISIAGKFIGGYVRIIGNNNRLIIEKGCFIPNITIIFRSDYGEIIIKKDTIFRKGCNIVCQGHKNFIHVGEGCLFSDEVNIWNSDTHQIVDECGCITNPSRPIVIDNHVWVGRSVSILKGTTIGKDSIIGMSSVVTKSLPSGSVAAGFPAHVIKTNRNWNRSFVEDVIF